LSDLGGISIVALQQADIGLATLVLGNGKVIIGQAGWVADEPEVNTEEGKYEVKLEFLLTFEQPSI
jgi:Phage tail tube protein